MNARHKLNSHALYGALTIAAILGILFGSWTVFLIASAILIGGAMLNSDIRLDSGRSSYRRCR